MTLLSPETPLEQLDWIPRQRIAPLRRLELLTLEDLIRHLPRRYEDRRAFDRFPTEASESTVCVCGTVHSTSYRRFGPRRIFEAILEDEAHGILGGLLTCRWYNMPWVQKMICSGQRLVVFGKPRERSRKIVMEHPEFEEIDEEGTSSIHFHRITPVHSAGDGITPKILRELVHHALAETNLHSMTRLWPGTPEPRRAEVWRAVHFPESLEECESARRQLVRDVFFGIQLVIGVRRGSIQRSGGVSRPGTGTLWGKLESALPFDPTPSQREVFAEISADMAAPFRMNRLLQGDVGSGKTLVALRAMIQAHESGWQSALMAPTQILAEQHYLNFRRLLDPLGIPVALRTASRREEAGTTGLPGLFAKTPHGGLVIGTHALLFEGSDFARLGLVVIDEQHKFGVAQRTRLIERADKPDVLVMTATPIPRTITQTLYGDLDVSILREKPAGRGRLTTVVRGDDKRVAIVDFVKNELTAGRQAYIVCPLVEESEKLVAKAATAEFGKWRDLLAPATVGLVHGRMDANDKDSVMQQFRDGTLSALVSTTVIEVGVDVPNATIMLIEEAGRFGLAQMHQLRGRIGRGPLKSWCILMHDGANPQSLEKLQIMERTSDGFEIAEADLRLRGPGDLMGTAQTGLPDFGPGDLVRDSDLMTEARRAAQTILADDPDLAYAEHAAMRAFVDLNSAAANLSAG